MRLFLTLFIYIACLPSFAGDIYVSPCGSDKNDGTESAPLQTIQRALRMAREWRRTNAPRIVGGINICLQAGAEFLLDEPLYLRPEDSGTRDSKTTIKVSPNPSQGGGQGMAIISGAEKASLLGRGRVRLLGRSLWHNGKKLQLASQFPAGKMEPMLAFDKDNETITIPAQSLLKFGIRTIEDAPQLEMIVHQRWAIAILRVKDIRIDGDKAVLSFMNPESRWEFAHPWPQPVFDGDRGVSTYCLVNARQFMDEPDEWWQDYRTGEIFGAGDDYTTARLSRLITIEGNEAERVHDIVFENVAISYAAWQRPMDYGHVTLQGGFPIIDAYKLTEHEGLPWAKGLENQAWIARPEAAVSVAWAERVDFRNCEFSHLASTGLDYTIGCRDIRIEDNNFFDIGGTAIMAGSFAEGPTEVHRPYGMTIGGDVKRLDHLFTEQMLIAGNTITDATNEDWGAVAIGCGFVRDVTIERNDVSHVNYSGICIGWGWTPDDTGMRNNRIIGNTVSDYARQLYDAGGIYTMSNQPNSLIEGNTVSAAHEAPYATNYRAFPIYFDAYTDGFTVRNNTLGTTSVLREKYGYNNPGPKLAVVE